MKSRLIGLLWFALSVLFVSPVIITSYHLVDIYRNPLQIPQFTLSWHQNLSKDIKSWAESRVENKLAISVDQFDVAGTEWPIFSSVFYLWATESLEKNSHFFGERNPPPSVYAREAIEASIKLIVDPNHANWVKKHWGDDYLSRENIFYRMLLISGITSYQILTLDAKYEPMLRAQVTSLMDELEQSPHGLLDDYPGECYGIDIVPAIANIAKAGRLLKINTDEFVKRAKRGFTGEAADPLTQLPTYQCDPLTGKAVGQARGVGVSYSLIWSADIWPELSRHWYKSYKQHFYLDRNGYVGVSAFAKSLQINHTFFDIDAGPVIWGASTSGSAFGIAASIRQGHFADAYPMLAEALLFSWPLPGVGMSVPKMLSDLEDAPYTGEAAMLFVLTRVPSKSASKQNVLLPNPFDLPLVFYLVCTVNLLIFILFFTRAVRCFSASKEGVVARN